MLLFLRAFFLIVLASMLAVTSWASVRCPLFAVPRDIFAHPWFIATMFDAYWGFLTFYVWVCCKRPSRSARAVWLIAILLLGNIAMASFCLRELLALPRHSRVTDVLITPRPGADWLGVLLAVVGAIVVGVALHHA